MYTVKQGKEVNTKLIENEIRLKSEAYKINVTKYFMDVIYMFCLYCPSVNVMRIVKHIKYFYYMFTDIFLCFFVLFLLYHTPHTIFQEVAANRAVPVANALVESVVNKLNNFLFLLK